jgi:hypothetical protein
MLKHDLPDLVGVMVCGGLGGAAALAGWIARWRVRRRFPARAAALAAESSCPACGADDAAPISRGQAGPLSGLSPAVAELHPRRHIMRRSIVAFRSAKRRLFAERKATLPAPDRRGESRSAPCRRPTRSIQKQATRPISKRPRAGKNPSNPTWAAKPPSKRKPLPNMLRRVWSIWYN